MPGGVVQLLSRLLRRRQALGEGQPCRRQCMQKGLGGCESVEDGAGSRARKDDDDDENDDDDDHDDGKYRI